MFSIVVSVFLSALVAAGVEKVRSRAGGRLTTRVDNTLETVLFLRTLLMLSHSIKDDT